MKNVFSHWSFARRWRRKEVNQLNINYLKLNI